MTWYRWCLTLTIVVVVAIMKGIRVAVRIHRVASR